MRLAADTCIAIELPDNAFIDALGRVIVAM